MVPISAKHSDLGKFSSSKAPEYRALLSFIRGTIRLSQNRIASGFPEDAKSEISGIIDIDSDRFDNTSVSSESHFDVPGKLPSSGDVVRI
jgi:hypothetical protein